MTQASTALSIVVPAGMAAGVAGSYGMLRRWGFASRDVTLAITLTGLWNQFLNLAFPIVAVFLLAIPGESAAALATVAFVGVAILGVRSQVRPDPRQQPPRRGHRQRRRALRELVSARSGAGPSPGAGRASSASEARPSTCSSVAGTC